jgi:hypothetical protein
VEGWAEVHRLFHREERARAAIARRLGIGRNRASVSSPGTSHRGFGARPQGSQLDPFADRIAAKLAEDPTVRAMVIRERLQAGGTGAGSRSSRTTSPRSARRSSTRGRIRGRRTGRARSGGSTGGIRETRSRPVAVGPARRSA